MSGTWINNRDAAELDSDPGRCERRDIELAFGADVQKSTAKGHGHRKPGENQRRRVEKRVANAVRPRKRAADQKFVRLKRAVADNPHDDAADDERSDDGNQRKQNLAQ